MTTLIDTVQPTEAQLEAVLAPVLVNGLTEETWLDQVTSNIIQTLKDNPRLYVAYGPWWPAVKELIVGKGDDSFGLLNRTDIYAIYHMSSEALTALAAILYMNERVETGMVYSKEHNLEVNASADDTEPYYFVCEDEQMDWLIQQRGNFNGSTKKTS